MSEGHSDALVFFGATGDLAFKKIFPALQAMAKRGHLDMPVIGVAKAGWGATSTATTGTRRRSMRFVSSSAPPSALPTTSRSRPRCSGRSWQSWAGRVAPTALA